MIPPLFEGLAELGLSTGEAARRLDEVGANELQREERTPPWRFFIGQFRSPVVLLLLGAAIVSGALSNLALLAVVTTSALVQIAIHHLPFTVQLFGIGTISFEDCALSVLIGLVPVTVIELAKLIRGRGR